MSGIGQVEEKEACQRKGGKRKSFGNEHVVCDGRGRKLRSGSLIREGPECQSKHYQIDKWFSNCTPQSPGGGVGVLGA
jgi:hypothetical protein